MTTVQEYLAIAGNDTPNNDLRTALLEEGFVLHDKISIVARAVDPTFDFGSILQKTHHIPVVLANRFMAAANDAHAQAREAQAKAAKVRLAAQVAAAVAAAAPPPPTTHHTTDEMTTIQEYLAIAGNDTSNNDLRNALLKEGFVLNNEIRIVARAVDRTFDFGSILQKKYHIPVGLANRFMAAANHAYAQKLAAQANAAQVAMAAQVAAAVAATAPPPTKTHHTTDELSVIGQLKSDLSAVLDYFCLHVLSSQRSQRSGYQRINTTTTSKKRR